MVVVVVDGGNDRDGDSELLVATDDGPWFIATMAEDWWLAIGFGWIEGMTDDLWPTGSWKMWLGWWWAEITIDNVRESRSASYSIEDLKGEVWSQ